jgi:DNA-binding response OmpR family regulator
MPKKILVVEDERKILRLVRDYMEQAGFAVVMAEDGVGALQAYRSERPNLVILDLGLPGIDGLEVTRAIRRDSNVPIIMLTARLEETDKLVGLELGADDYVTKPFSPRELVARVRAVLRRAEGSPAEAEQVLRAGDVELDASRRSVAVAGRPVELTPTEFDILATLMRDPGRVFSRVQLLEGQPGDAYEGYERTVDAHIKNLRAKIELDPRKPRYIHTVYGVGYRFDAQP